MKLKIDRSWCGPKCTIGTLAVDGAFEAFTLEDVVREVDGKPVSEWKVPGATAIQKGTYPVVISYSNRFKRDLPLVSGVEGFTGIRIHPGNTAEDTEGCILVGMAKGPDSVTDSRVAFNALFQKIEGALDAGDTVTLEIA